VITPSGAKANRLFVVGVLTEVEDVNDEMIRARVVDPTGAFVVYAGQYQPDERAFFERADPPAFVAVTGKARTFKPDGADRVFSSVRPESVSAVDADTRDRWAVDAARDTLERVAAMAAAIREGADEDPTGAGLDPAGGIALALDHYGTTGVYLEALRDLALDTLRVVAGDRDEVRPLDAAPDDGGTADVDALAALSTGRETPAAATATGDTAEVGDADEAAEAEGVETGGSADAGSTEATGAEPGAATESEAGSTEPETADPEAGSTESATAGTDEAEVAAEADTGAAEATEADTGAAEADATPEATAGGGSASTTDDDIGDFEPGDLSADADENGGGEVADADLDVDADEMYELDEEERREVEEEYGTEFSTGSEVGSPGEGSGPAEPETAGEPADDDESTATEADDEPEPVEARSDEATADETGAAEAEASEPEAVEAEADEEDAAAAADPSDVLMDHMRDLDDGSGADREELVASVMEATGADADEVDDAIQDALMGGQCYEPDDDTLKPI